MILQKVSQHRLVKTLAEGRTDNTTRAQLDFTIFNNFMLFRSMVIDLEALEYRTRRSRQLSRQLSL